MKLGDRVKDLRKEKGMTQQELAERLGYNHKSSVAHIENNERDIPRSMVVLLAEVLGTTPAYLMGWTEEKTAPEKENDLKGDIIAKINQLSDSQLDRLLGYLEALLSE